MDHEISGRRIPVRTCEPREQAHPIKGIDEGVLDQEGLAQDVDDGGALAKGKKDCRQDGHGSVEDGQDGHLGQVGEDEHEDDHPDGEGDGG